MSACRDESFENSRRIKGFGFPQSDDEYFREQMARNPQFSLPDGKRKDAEKSSRMADECDIKPVVVESLEEYVKEIARAYDDLNRSICRLGNIYWRGSENANYLPVPRAFRDDNAIEREHILLEEFAVRFSEEVDSYARALSRLAFMAHYETATRLLDITENPLVALLFACTNAKTQLGVTETCACKWGCVELFIEPNEDDDDSGSENAPDSMKYEKSPTASIIACTAFMKRTFSLKRLGMAFKNDGSPSMKTRHIKLSDVVRRSVIVHAGRRNARMQNQSGLFIAVNANEICAVNKKDGAKSGVNALALTKHIISAKEGDGTSLAHLKKNAPFSRMLNGVDSWGIVLKKVSPYDKGNKIEEFKNDPFGINRLMYKDRNGFRRVILVPPTAKKRIMRELEQLGMTNSFVYPEKSSASGAIARRFKEMNDSAC